MKRIAAVCVASLIFPYVLTMAWTGRQGGTAMAGVVSSSQIGEGERVIVLDREGAEQPVLLEEYLIGIVAEQIPAEYELETIKAQMIIARTYLYGVMGEEHSIPESALDLDILTESGMQELWGKDYFLRYYNKFADAAKETEGQILTFDGSPIDPLFHGISAGKTREGYELHPYLVSVDCPEDVNSPGYLTVETFTPEEFCKRLNGMENSPELSADTAFESIQIVEKDGAGYVSQVKAGEKLYTGEEIQYALGLKSCAFSFEKMESGIRCVTEGKGHGYGFDQWGANEKAKEGYTAEELLKFYYKNIVLISE